MQECEKKDTSNTEYAHYIKKLFNDVLNEYEIKYIDNDLKSNWALNAKPKKISWSLRYIFDEIKGGNIIPIKEKRFSVALSFPSEYREIVGKIAKILSISISKEKIFYDDFYISELAGINLDSYLQDIYGNQSDLVVVFAAEEYSSKKWCNTEWRSIRSLIHNGDLKNVMFVSFGSINLPGMFDIDGYIPAEEYSEIDIASFILERHKSM